MSAPAVTTVIVAADDRAANRPARRAGHQDGVRRLPAGAPRGAGAAASAPVVGDGAAPTGRGAAALASGRPVVIPHLTDDDVVAMTADEEPRRPRPAAGLRRRHLPAADPRGAVRRLHPGQRVRAGAAHRDGAAHRRDRLAAGGAGAGRRPPGRRGPADGGAAAARPAVTAGAARALVLAVRYRPATRGVAIGGDRYDAFLQPDGDTVLVIGDVMGHDIEAAAAIGQVKTLVRGIAFDRLEEPAGVLRRVDHALVGLAVPATRSATGCWPRWVGEGVEDDVAVLAVRGHPVPGRPAGVQPPPPGAPLRSGRPRRAPPRRSRPPPGRPTGSSSGRCRAPRGR